MESLLKKTTKEDQQIALSSITSLQGASNQISPNAKGGVKIKIQNTEEFITIPKKALSLLFAIISNMAAGKSITLLPTESEVSTQQAADMLNVSRPHIVKLLETGAIPFKKVGSHRRIQLKDLVTYENKSKKKQKESLEFLAQQAQDLQLGYE